MNDIHLIVCETYGEKYKLKVCDIRGKTLKELKETKG